MLLTLSTVSDFANQSLHYYEVDWTCSFGDCVSGLQSASFIRNLTCMLKLGPTYMITYVDGAPKRHYATVKNIIVMTVIAIGLEAAVVIVIAIVPFLQR